MTKKTAEPKIKLEYNDSGHHRIIFHNETGKWSRYASISQLGNLRGFSPYWDGTFEEGVYRVEKVGDLVVTLKTK